MNLSAFKKINAMKINNPPSKKLFEEFLIASIKNIYLG